MGIDYSVPGLRTRENKMFTKYFNLVQLQAKKKGMTFFLDCAEGAETLFDDMEVVDVSGWLVPDNKIIEFERIWKSFEEDDEWVDYYCFAEPVIVDKKVIVDFKYY